MKALLRIGTASALALTISLAGPALAQDVKTTETTKTTTTDPVTDTKTTTSTKTSAKPVTDESGAPATQVKTTTKTKAKAAGTPTETTKSTTEAVVPAGTAPTTDPAAPVGAVPATPATTANAPASPNASATATNPTVGGAQMVATKTIVENASAAPNLSTLVSAVKAADLVATLSGPGPFTVFAPTDDAFGRVAQATRDTLMKPEAKPTLARVLKYHVVPGTLTLADLKAKAAAGGTLTTAEGQTLTVKVNTTAGGEAIELTDAVGNKSYIETADVRQSNGIVHVVNGVLFPKLQ